MNDELETKIRGRAYEKWVGENRPSGLAERHWLDAELQVIEEAENAAVSRWAAPVRGTYVEKSNQAARIAEDARDAGGVDLPRKSGETF